MFVDKHRGHLLVPLGAVLMLMASACSSSSGGQPASANEQAETSAQAAQDVAGQSQTSATSGQAGAGKSSSSASQTRGSGTSTKADKRYGPEPLDFPYESEVDVKAVTDPACVTAGQTITLTVTAPSGAAIVYQAVYSDSRGGSDAPFGGGYGGNDKGYADPTGRWQSSWLVSTDAPAGPARVDVIVGYKGKWGYTDPHFAVADAGGNCPSRWLDEE